MRLRAPRLQILDLYVLRRFALIYAANLLCFTSIFILIDAVTHYDDFARGGGGLVQSLLTCLRYYVALTPLIFCQILGPVVAVSSGLFTVSTFLRANEFVPILAAGRSLKRALGSILAASFLLSGAVFAIQELWIPRTVSAIHAAVESREGRDIYRHVKHRDGRGNLLSFETYDFFGRKAEGVLVLPVARGVGNQFLIHARSAEWLPALHPRPRASSGHWLLRRGTVQEYDPQGGLVAQRPAGGAGKASLYLPFEERILETDLIPEDIEIRKEETVYMTLAALRKKMRSSPDQSAWTIKYYSRFAYPATNFILILLGLPVIVFFGNRNIFFGAIIALAISTAYFVLNSVFQDLGIKGWISPRLATGLAPILFLSLGATLYREMEG